MSLLYKLSLRVGDGDLDLDAWLDGDGSLKFECQGRTRRANNHKFCNAKQRQGNWTQ